MNELDLGVEKLGLKRMGYSDAFNKGNEIGKDFEKFIGDMFGKNSTFDPNKNLPPQPAGNGLGEGGNVANNVSDIANNTRGINDSVEITREDIKHLIDKAEQETINRFTTAKININMKNNNKISNDMDIDGIVDQLPKKVNDAMENAAQGVYT